MMNDEIEDGELTSDEELNDSKSLQKSSSNIIESGELTEDNSPKTNNPYTEEDEDMIELKMKALKSLLDKEPSDKLNKVYDKKIKKKSSKKLKMKKKLKKQLDRPSPGMSLNDNYELKDMEIEPISYQTQMSQFSPFQAISAYEQFTYMQSFLNAFGQFNQMLYSQWPPQQNQQQQKQVQRSNMGLNMRHNYLTKPKKKFKKNQNIKPVKKVFTPVNSVDEVPLFSSNGLDLDERFLDQTTTTLDVDYRQLNQVELLKKLEQENIDFEKLNEVEERDLFEETNLIEEKVEDKKQEEEDKAKPNETEEDEAELMDLRKNLLDTMKKQRSLKKQQEEEKIDKDITLLKKKLAEHEQVLFQSGLNELKNKIKQNQAQTPLQKSKIAPIIIRINANDSSDEEESESKKSLEKNIGLFLKEAKQLADEKEKKSIDPEPSQNSEKEQEKKAMIKSLRDRINLKNKMLVELTKRSKDIDATELKKQKDVDFTKLRIAMLKEQLIASEKILQVNEQTLVDLKNQKRLVNLRLIKLQNMKKNQQEMLQKLLNSTHQAITPALPKSPPPPAEALQPPIPPTPKPKTPLVTSILKKMTLGSVVAETIKTQKPVKPQSQITRPNLNTSKQTDKKLEQLVVKNQVLGNSSNNLNENIVINAKVISSQTDLKKSNGKKVEMENRQKLIDFLDELSRDYPFVHSETFDLWSHENLFQSNTDPVNLMLNNDVLESNISDLKPSSISVRKVLTSSNFCSLNECEVNTRITLDNEIYKIEDVNNYESPLKVFRGYRFSSHFSQFNSFDEAYSKTYCNAIDYRKPFCPFDLHGSCKDSNCIYQHSNIMTMDNYQRTEHFLSYCPQLLELSSDTPTQREAIKKLRLYAKQFMNNNLNKMSIKDYFKHLYDHVIENLNIEPSYSTILSRLPIMCINNNKSIGVFDHFELENEANGDIQITNNPQLIKLNTDQAHIEDSNDSLTNLLDLVISANYSRILDSKFKKLVINNEFDLDLLKSESDYFETEIEKILSWIYYAKWTCSSNFQIEKLLNVFSYALESRPKCEILWILYLKTYLHKKNSQNDYHELCFLCMDNLVTYDIVWFILNTCPFEYLDLIFEKYEKYLITVTPENLSTEFEQGTQNDYSERISYYLFELILFHTYTKQVNCDKPIELLHKYLNNQNIIVKLEPNDLSLLWLCLIHFEAFNHLPSWIKFPEWNSKYFRSFESKNFWLLNPMRIFNQQFFNSINFGYKHKVLKTDDIIQRQFDIFMIPWKTGTKYTCSIEKIQNLFHVALRSISLRCPANTSTSLKTKQEIRLYSLPLFINLIYLEVSNKRYEIASKIIDRLLKSADAKFLKELWIILIYILKCQNLGQLIEQNLSLALQMFPNDPHLIYISAQYFNSIDEKCKALDLIEAFINDLYSSRVNASAYEPILLFRHYLGIEKCEKLKNVEFNFGKKRLEIAILYCYYLQLKGVEFYTLKYIQENIENVVKKFNLVNYRAILWIRYLKFMSTLESNMEGYSEKVLKLIENCAQDLSREESKLLIPFNYIPEGLVLRNSSHKGDFLEEKGLSPDRLYYSNSNAKSILPIRTSNYSFITNSFFYNCIVDYLLKTYTHNQSDKISLTKYLMNLNPYCSDLIKMYVSFSYKLNGLHKTLQNFYDHLSMNGIDNEHLWLLCIKLCLDMNDFQQAVLIYHKADSVCTRGKKSSIELKRVSALLFPTLDTNLA